MRLRRRQLLCGLAGVGLAAGARAQPAADTAHRLVLLGVRGGPLVTSSAQTPSASLIVFRGVPYVVDAGYGVTLRLLEAGVALRELGHVFVTHHHSDHNLELGPLLYNAWVGGLQREVGVHGPPGLDDLLSAYWLSNRFDIETRIADEGRPDLRTLVQAHEFGPGIVMTSGDVRVTALMNRHPPVSESYALKFELGAKTVVFSGDTAFLPELAAFARGADYLVHEVMYPSAVEALVARRPNAARLRESILSHHTSAQDAGRIAALARAKCLVLNHFVPGDDPSLTPRMWQAAAAKHFPGRIVVGSPLLTLPL